MKTEGLLIIQLAVSWCLYRTSLDTTAEDICAPKHGPYWFFTGQGQNLEGVICLHTIGIIDDVAYVEPLTELCNLDDVVTGSGCEAASCT